MSLLPFKSSHKPQSFDLAGNKALVITTSQATLDKLDPDTGELLEQGVATGVYASEMTEPYYAFLDAGLEVDLASIKGGVIPIEPASLKFPLRTHYDTRFMKDSQAQEKAKQSRCIDDVDFSEYDIIFIAGGWGAAYDLEQSKSLAEKVSAAYARGQIMGSVCHGALGFTGAKKPDGRPLVEGLKITGVTNRQLEKLGITHTPRHPETQLKKFGADYQCSHNKLTDLFANHVTVDDEHKIVSAQNQKGGIEAAEQALLLLEEDRG